MNWRLTLTAAAAVLLTSLSLNAVILGNGWIVASIGAVATVALAGVLTRATGPRATAATTFLVLVAVIPLLVGPAWLARAAGIVILLLAAAGATGGRLLRGFATIATYLASLLIYLCIAFATSDCYARVIPSHHAVTMLGHLYSLAVAEFQYKAPVPDIVGVSFFAGAGVGLVAIIVDLLAVRLRRPALAGLPLLLLFSVPVASNLQTIALGQSITFALSLAGYLAMLSADGRDRLRMWGRVVTFRHVQTADESGTGPDTRELSASGRRIGLAALCLAVIVPALVPPGRVHDVFGTTVSGGSGKGSTSVALQPLLLVQQELESKPLPVLSYTTTDPNPTDQYFQAYVLNFDANKNNWLPSSRVGDQLDGPQLPWQPPGVMKRTPFITSRTTITMSKYQSGQAVLPLPYAPERLLVPGGTWREAKDSLMVTSDSVPLAGLHYSVTSKEPQPTGPQIDTVQPIPTSVLSAYGLYPGPYAGRLLAIASQHVGGAATPLQYALDLQNWFRSSAFTYRLKPNLPSSSDWLVKFLTTDKRGVCRQFAWAFAVLARLLGIPSRIAVGYTAGTTSGHSGVWQVTTADAHAWPELYFPGYGWLRFEPTPTSHGQGTATVPTYAIPPGGLDSQSQSGQSSHSSKSQGSQTKGAGRAANNRNAQLCRGVVSEKVGCNAFTPPAVRSARASGLAIGIGIAVLVFLLLAWPAVTRLVTRRRRWLTASGDAGLANAAWRELVDDMADLGVPCSPSESPRAAARRIAREGSLDAAAVQAVTRLGAAEERARYAQGPQPGAGLAGDVRTVRQAVAASASPRQRLRARLAPASTLTAAARMMQRASEMLNWLESSWPSLRRQLRTVLHRTG